IAISILVKEGLINIEPQTLNNSLFLGELALDGRVRGVNGVLPIAISAKALNINNIFVPKENSAEASLVKDINIFPISTLTELINHLENRVKITAAQNNSNS